MRRLAALLVALAAFGALAEGRRILPAHEQAAWNALGRVNFGDGFCTGAMVAPDLVVTAAHCVFSAKTGLRRPDASFRFVAGYRLRKYAGLRRLSVVAAHPGYAYDRVADQQSVETDVALLTLDRPIDGVAPFAIAPGLRAGDRVTVLSYGRDRPELPSIQSGCAVTRLFGAVAELACDAVSGVSGAPVFRQVDGAPKIVAVISAIGADTPKRAYAVVLDAALPAVLAIP